MNWNPFSGPQSSLTLFTWTYIRSSQANDILRAWTAAFVLTLLVLVLFVIARIIGGRGPGEVGYLRRAIQNRRSGSE
jgi:phosphate transport system permease protein